MESRSPHRASVLRGDQPYCSSKEVELLRKYFSTQEIERTLESLLPSEAASAQHLTEGQKTYIQLVLNKMDPSRDQRVFVPLSSLRDLRQTHSLGSYGAGPCTLPAIDLDLSLHLSLCSAGDCRSIDDVYDARALGDEFQQTNPLDPSHLAEKEAEEDEREREDGDEGGRDKFSKFQNVLDSDEFKSSLRGNSRPVLSLSLAGGEAASLPTDPLLTYAQRGGEEEFEQTNPLLSPQGLTPSSQSEPSPALDLGLSLAPGLCHFSSLESESPVGESEAPDYSWGQVRLHSVYSRPPFLLVGCRVLPILLDSSQVQSEDTASRDTASSLGQESAGVPEAPAGCVSQEGSGGFSTPAANSPSRKAGAHVSVGSSGNGGRANYSGGGGSSSKKSVTFLIPARPEVTGSVRLHLE